jgi:hypothetical protein
MLKKRNSPGENSRFRGYLATSKNCARSIVCTRVCDERECARLRES